MNYILFNADGSIKKTNFTEIITQNSNETYQIFVSVDDLENLNQYSASAVFVLPDKSASAEIGTFEQGVEYADGQYADGFVFTLTSAETSIAGLVQLTIQIKRTSTQQVLYTYRVPLTINATADLETYVNITLAQYNNLLEFIGGGDLVPYTGATKNVDLGNHSLSANEVAVSKENGSAYYDNDGINVIKTGSDVVFYYPDTATFDTDEFTFATEEWVKRAALVRNDDGYWLADTDGSSGIVFEDDGYPILTLEEDGIRVTNWGEDETLVEFPTKSGGGTEQVAYRSQLPSKNTIGTFNTSGFAVPSGADYYKIDNISLSGTLGDLLIITWGNAFAICPVPSLGNYKGEQLIDGVWDVAIINNGADVYGEYSLLGDWRENELYPTAGCDVYLYGTNDYHKRYENGVIEVIEVYQSGGQTYTKVGITWHLDDYVINLCPGYDGSYDIEEEEVWERAVKREGHVVASLIGSDGSAKVVKVKYEITDNDSKLSITTDSSFTPPASYTGYVINYKII